MADLETNLLNALQNAQATAGEKPCGCHENQAATSEEATFDQLTDSSDLVAQLDSALGAALSGAESEFASLDTLSLDEELAFAQMSEGTNLSLEDILALTEKYPGLKITFSY
jgi:hypothetical protein